VKFRGELGSDRKRARNVDEGNQKLGWGGNAERGEKGKPISPTV